jgi:peptidoglycan/LPS O-acetylase OafA/YrhL
MKIISYHRNEIHSDLAFKGNQNAVHERLRFFRNLKVYKFLVSSNRISSLDVFRGLAIILVVLYHWNQGIYFGTIGVDLFFVISGFLVGGILIREFDKPEGVNVPRFILQRGFKIWPSYYFLLAFGSIVAYLFYHRSHPGQLIPLSQFSGYAFFYMNYLRTDHGSFDQAWSLCVEEHFYILMPLTLFIIQRTVHSEKRGRALLIVLFCAIIIGFVSKIYSLYFTQRRNTYLGTQDRIDSLAWGVLLYIFITHYGE